MEASMNERDWLRDYFARYHRSLCDTDVREEILSAKALLQTVAARGGKVIIAGNGGSAAIAGHCALDLTKHGGVRCLAFGGVDWVTALANDYGYEHWIERTLEMYAVPGDAVVLISSSGKSPNVVRAAEYARRHGLPVVTFTGFAPDNPLRALGDINFWVDSRAYNVVEMTHHIWLLAICDVLIGQAEYSPSAPIAKRI